MRHVTVTAPLSGVLCHSHDLTCYDQRIYQIRIYIFTGYEDIKGDAKCRKWSGLGVFSVTQGH